MDSILEEHLYNFQFWVITKSAAINNQYLVQICTHFYREHAYKWNCWVICVLSSLVSNFELYTQYNFTHGIIYTKIIYLKRILALELDILG